MVPLNCQVSQRGPPIRTYFLLIDLIFFELISLRSAYCHHSVVKVLKLRRERKYTFLRNSKLPFKSLKFTFLLHFDYM